MALDREQAETSALHKALVRGDLPDVVVDGVPRRPTEAEVIVRSVEQTWREDRMGFDATLMTSTEDGDPPTTAWTTVVMCKSGAAVYFDGEWAYTVLPSFNMAFMDDFIIGAIKSQRYSSAYGTRIRPWDL